MSLSWSPTALRPWHLSTHFVGRNPPKHTLLRQGYGGYPPRIHPRVYTRGFLRRRVNVLLQWLTAEQLKSLEIRLVAGSERMHLPDLG